MSTGGCLKALAETKPAYSTFGARQFFESGGIGFNVTEKHKWQVKEGKCLKTKHF